jgi:hypothetical protein
MYIFVCFVWGFCAIKYLRNFLIQFWVLVKQQLLEGSVSFTGVLIWACCDLVFHFTISLSLVLSHVMIRCLLCIRISFPIYVTGSVINTCIAGFLKCSCLSEGSIIWGMYLDKDWGEMLVDEEPAVWNNSFFWFKRGMIRIAHRWWYVESRSSIRQVQWFTGPKHWVGLWCINWYQGSFFSHLILDSLPHIFFGHVIIGGIEFLLPLVLHSASN